MTIFWKWVDTEDPCEMGEIRDTQGRLICDFGDSTTYYPTQGTPPEDQDRRLMVAAPELFDLIDDLNKSIPADYSHAEYCHRTDDCDADECGHLKCPNCDCGVELADRARELIAKIRGDK